VKWSWFRLEGEAKAERSADRFESFFRQEYRRLAGGLFVLTGDAKEAEDLAQEAMARVFERWDRVQAMESPTGYLFRTALNLHRKRLRRAGVRARRDLSPELPPDPLAAVDDRDHLRRLLATLTDGQREALILTEVGGFGAEEAGRLLGVEAATVRTRVHRARMSLREMTEDRDG